MITENVLRKELGRSKDFVALVVVDPKAYNNASVAIVKHLTANKKIPGVYVSVNKPFKILNEHFKKEGVKTELMIFIDAITSLADENLEENEHCYYLESPENLSDISIAISQAIEAIDHKEKFIIIDSLSTLLIYNNIESITKFVHFIIGKMRSWDVIGIILSLKKRGEAGLIAEIGQFCDMTIEL